VSDAASDAFGIGRRRLIISIAVAALLVAGATAIVGEAADYHRLAQAATRASLAWLPLCACGELLAYAGYILAYRDVARVGGGPRLSPWTATRVVVLGFGAFAVGSGAGGLAADFWALHRASDRPHQSARRVLGMNTLEWAVLSFAAWAAALLLVLGVGSGAPAAMTIAWLAVVPVCVVLAIWCTQPSRVERFTRIRPGRERPHGRDLHAWAGWLAARARNGLADAIGGVVAVRRIVRGARRYPAGVVGFPIYWAGDVLTLYAALRAFGVSVGVAALVLAYASGYVIAALPLPAGGAGATEATLASTVHLIGVPFAPALLAAVLYRIFSFWLPIIPALLFLPLAQGLAEDLDRTPLQESDAPLAELTGEDEEGGG
jgi:putative heme transporter